MSGYHIPDDIEKSALEYEENDFNSSYLAQEGLTEHYVDIARTEFNKDEFQEFLSVFKSLAQSGNGYQDSASYAYNSIKSKKDDYNLDNKADNPDIGQELSSPADDSQNCTYDDIPF